jgi:hypothetical protein
VDPVPLVHQELVKKRILHHRTEPSILRGPLRTFNAAARAHFLPTTLYRGKVKLLLAKDSQIPEYQNSIQFARTVRDWSQWAPQLSHAVVPGNHIGSRTHFRQLR